MARRRPPEEHENHERWLVSYADFITLLFAFFVVMYSISSINEGKYKILSDSLVGVFNQVDRSVKPIPIGEERPRTTEADVSQVEDLSGPASSAGKPTLDPLERIAQSMRETFGPQRRLTRARMIGAESEARSASLSTWRDDRPRNTASGSASASETYVPSKSPSAMPMPPATGQSCTASGAPS